MEFTSTGNNHHFDFWMVNKQRYWAVIPPETIHGFSSELPICLQSGTASWGKKHIEHRHKHWLEKQQKTVCELLYEKLGQPGSFFSSEEANKVKLVMRLAPDSLLILRHVENRTYGDFLTVTTMYQVPRHIDGTGIGRYVSEYRTMIK
ncbi:MAG TPA: hypothetical protein PLB10_09630 [Thiolinea sp.]|nr:hypothetical protein [Thiolinea sp.]